MAGMARAALARRKRRRLMLELMEDGDLIKEKTGGTVDLSRVQKNTLILGKNGLFVVFFVFTHLSKWGPGARGRRPRAANIDCSAAPLTKLIVRGLLIRR
jgi:hypothetical protein